MILRIVLIQSISNFDYCLLSTYRIKIICLIISQGYLRKYGRFINNSQNKKEKCICRQLFSYFFCSARVKWGTCYSLRSMAFCSKYHWLRKKTIIYSPKCNQHIFSKFSEHLARLFLLMWERGQMSALSTVKVRGIPCHVLQLPVFFFFFAFKQESDQGNQESTGAAVKRQKWSPWGYALCAKAPAQLTAMELCRLRHAVHAYIVSHTSPLPKTPRPNQQRKRKSTGKSILQLSREVKQGVTQKTSFLLLK